MDLPIRPLIDVPARLSGMVAKGSGSAYRFVDATRHQCVIALLL